VSHEQDRAAREAAHAEKVFDAIDEKLAQEPMLRFFRYEHLRGPLAEVSAPFCEQARRIVLTLPRHPERTVTLRKLLEAKDAAVRTALVAMEPA
jgi:hypothetical protein